MPPDPPSWTEWGSWSTCSQSCGGGQKHRERTCNSKNTLSPVHEVHTRIVNRPPDCPGNPRDTESCHNQDCPGRDYIERYMRRIQCTPSVQKKWPHIRRNCLSKSPRVSTMDSVGPLEHLLQILWRRKTEQRKKMQEEEQLCRPSHRFKLENSERALGMFRQVSGD